jgi:ankyrin repeat protein
MHYAIFSNEVQSVEIMERFGGDITVKNGSGMGGLHLAAQSGSVAMMAYLLVRYKTIEN